jgi:hypothetical protein
VKSHGEFWGRPFLRETPQVESEFITYTVKKPKFTLEYRFEKAKVAQLKKILNLEKKSQDFSLGRRASRLWYTMIVLTAEHGKGTSGSFTVGDIVKIWGSQDSGRLYEDIRQTFMSLAAFNPIFSNYQADKKRQVWGYSFLKGYLIKGDGDSAVFSFTLNEIALGITTEWLNNKKLNEASLKSGYLMLPVAKLREKRGDLGYENFRERVRLLKPGIVRVKFYTILDEWIKVGDDMLKHRGECYHLVMKYCQRAKESGEIKSYKQEVITIKGWREQWQMQIHK